MNNYLELLDKNDPINVIHLAMNGHIINELFNYDSIKDYIQYMRELVSENVVVKKSTSNKFISNVIQSYEFFKRYNAQLKKQNTFQHQKIT